MPDILKLRCACPVCGSEGQLGGHLEIYGVPLSKAPLPLDKPALVAKWLDNGRWPPSTILAVAELLAKEKDWFQCASCDYYFPIRPAYVHALKLLALSKGDPEWAQALNLVNTAAGRS